MRLWRPPPRSRRRHKTTPTSSTDPAPSALGAGLRTKAPVSPHSAARVPAWVDGRGRLETVVLHHGLPLLERPLPAAARLAPRTRCVHGSRTALIATHPSPRRNDDRQPAVPLRRRACARHATSRCPVGPMHRNQWYIGAPMMRGHRADSARSERQWGGGCGKLTSKFQQLQLSC